MPAIREKKHAPLDRDTDEPYRIDFADDEDSIYAAHRTETFQTLASGIAHDFNNLLTAISGYSALALRAIDADHPAHAAIEEIERAAGRAEVLTRQLIEAGRPKPPRDEALTMSKILVEMGGMLECLVGASVCVRQRHEPRLACVVANRDEIQQLVLNLAINARDAMPGGGELLFETSNVWAGEAASSRSDGAEAGSAVSYVVLTVADTGTGMDEATLARIFEPFFTTKAPGKGSGLGLASAARTVRARGGRIEVESGPDAGTTFRIFLPAVDGPVDAGPVRANDARGSRNQ